MNCLKSCSEIKLHHHGCHIVVTLPMMSLGHRKYFQKNLHLEKKI